MPEYFMGWMGGPSTCNRSHPRSWLRGTETGTEGKTMNTRTKAEEWVRSDEFGVREDIERLGFDGAVSYNLELADGSEDARWHGIGHDAMRDAISKVERDQ